MLKQNNINVNQKFNKKHFKKVKKNNFTSIELSFSNIGFKASKPGFLTQKELNLIKFNLKKKFKKNIIIRNTVHPYQSITKKSVGIRMGKGKGPVENWVAPIKTGQIFFEFRTNLSEKNLIETLSKIKKKISIKTRIVIIKSK